jgi:hypothetical protein
MAKELKEKGRGIRDESISGVFFSSFIPHSSSFL